MNIVKVKLIRISDNTPVEKSLVNWKNLPANEKAAYRVVDGPVDNTSATKSVNVPEEVKLLRAKKLTPPVDNTSAAADEKGNAAQTNTDANPTEPSAEEKLKADVLKLYDELKGDYAERRKAIANKLGLHWRPVDKILSDAGKK